MFNSKLTCTRNVHRLFSTILSDEDVWRPYVWTQEYPAGIKPQEIDIILSVATSRDVALVNVQATGKL